ncbi:MAG TPA: hypothetical protein VFC46_13400 [Humisphaera sp.]|nr:hypothetical protein [Humisphaera sp.]
MPFSFFFRLLTDDYYLALGKFVTEFSEVEKAMQIALWTVSKTEEPVAQAVFSGVRANEACNKITRIGDAENWSQIKKDEWKIITDRLSIFRSLRNDILHYGVEWQRPNEWNTTNRTFAHTAEKVSNTPITIPILQAATDDLHKLGFHLFKFLYSDDMSPENQATIASFVAHAWRYTPPLQEGRPNRNPDSDSMQSRPPRPSAASRRKAALEKSKKT